MLQNQPLFHLVEIVNKSKVGKTQADVMVFVASFPQQSLDSRSDHSQFLNQIIKLNPGKPLMDQDFILSAAKTSVVAKSYQLWWQPDYRSCAMDQGQALPA